MIRIRRTKGKMQGDHFIFSDISEAKYYLGGELASYNTNGQNLDSAFCFKHWADLDVVEKDWIVDDTGKVVQVISHYELEGANKKTKPNPNVRVHCIKTAGGLGYYTEHIGGEKKGQISYKFGLQITEKSLENADLRNTMCRRERPILGSSFNVWKRLFVYYLVIYMSPIFALKMVIKRKGIKFRYVDRQLTKSALDLLQEPKVIKELEKYMEPETFRSKMLKALDMAKLDEERIAEELTSALDNVKPGTHTHLEVIQTVANLRRHAMDNENIGSDGKAIPDSKLKRIENAEYDFLPEAPKEIAGILDEKTRILVEDTNDTKLKEISKEIIERNSGEKLDDLMSSSRANGDDV